MYSKSASFELIFFFVYSMPHADMDLGFQISLIEESNDIWEGEMFCRVAVSEFLSFILTRAARKLFFWLQVYWERRQMDNLKLSR